MPTITWNLIKKFLAVSSGIPAKVRRALNVNALSEAEARALEDQIMSACCAQHSVGP